MFESATAVIAAAPASEFKERLLLCWAEKDTPINGPFYLELFFRYSQMSLLPAEDQLLTLVLDNLTDKLERYYLLSISHKLRNTDVPELFDCYQIAAAKGNPWAEFLFGAVYHAGVGCKQDPLTAQLWYERAAKKGLPAAQFWLAESYLTIDEHQADHWYRQAADNGFNQAKQRLILRQKPEVSTPPIVTQYQSASSAKGKEKEKSSRHSLRKHKKK